MENTEILIIVKQYGPDGSYKEWTTQSGLSVFTSAAKKQIKKILGAGQDGNSRGFS